MIRRLAIALLFVAVCGVAGPAGARIAMDAAPTAQSLPVWSTTQARRDRYVSAHGLRAFAGGYSEDGLEFWAYPLQIAAGYALDFVGPGSDALPGIELLEAVETDPLGVTRLYAGPGFRVRERIEARGSEPGVRVLLRVEGRPDVRIRARFRPSLNLMWPAGIGGQEIAWDADARGLVLSEPSRRFRALVASPQAGAHSVPNNDRRGSEFGRPLFLELEPVACGQARCATLVFAGQSEADDDVRATATALLRVPRAPTPQDLQRFDGARWLRITTPDPEANRALQWAQIALEQAWTCNPRLGCGLLAGYGPSHGARRPQYMWYFANDGLVNVRALVHEGDYARAAEELAFILRCQHPGNGMLWHELSQSAGFLDWANDYPYMYVHVDIAFEFLPVLAEYVRASGDEAFLRTHWRQVLAAYGYCRSTLDAGDGLSRVPADKMAGNEQDRLTDELTLSAAWVQAAGAMAQMAEAMGDTGLAVQAEAAAQRARDAIRTRYRDARNGRWISGFRRDGRPAESFSGADLAAIASGAATPEEAAATFDRLGSADYLTAWGLRSKPASASDYDPEAYAHGSVWGLGTATAAERLWRSGRAAQAAALWQRLVPWAAQDALGHMHEVQSGNAFAPQRESVPEQTWSSAAFLSAAIHGLLGLEVDAKAGVLTFAPQPPSAWKQLRVERVRVGARLVDLHWRREDGSTVLEVHNHGPAFRLAWKQAAHGTAAAGALTREILPGKTRLVMP